MSTEKKTPTSAAATPPSLQDRTPQKTTGYFTGQKIILTPELNANSGYDPTTYGTELDITPHPSGAAGLQPLPGTNYKLPIPSSFTTGTKQFPAPAVVFGIHNNKPTWKANTSGGKQSLAITPDPSLGGMPAPAFGSPEIEPITFLNGVATKTPPTGGPGKNQMRVQLTMQQADGTAVPSGSGPYMGYFHVRSSNTVMLDNLAVYYKVDSNAPILSTYTSGDMVWAESDPDGNFDIYIVPNDGTDSTNGWIDLFFNAGSAAGIQIQILFVPEKFSQQYSDGLLGAPMVSQAGAIVDPTYVSHYDIILDQYVLDTISDGTLGFLLINGTLDPSTVRIFKSGMKHWWPVFSIDSTNPLLRTVPEGGTLSGQNGNDIEYVLTDPKYTFRSSIEGIFWAQSSSNTWAPQGPSEPAGDSNMVAPTIREITGTVLRSADIAKANGVHVNITWDSRVWTPQDGESIQVVIWLNGYHEGGLDVNQHTLTNTLSVDHTTTSPFVVPFEMYQFADYGPPHNNASQYATMQVQFYVIDKADTYTLHTSPTLNAYLDTVPAGA